MTLAIVVLVVLCAYLIGSVPSGLLIGRGLWHVDLREHGSKNIGATNAYRTLGRRAALLIFAADLSKGMLGVYLAEQLSGAPWALVLGGVTAILGHSCSLFLHFAGGKGVATGLGVILMLMPRTTLVVFVVWCLVVYATRYVSLASIIAAALVPICGYMWGERQEYLILGLIAAVFVIYRHKTNISRLLAGNESRIKAADDNK